jgi:hypothetical protein
VITERVPRSRLRAWITSEYAKELREHRSIEQQGHAGDQQERRDVPDPAVARPSLGPQEGGRREARDRHRREEMEIDGAMPRAMNPIQARSDPVRALRWSRQRPRRAGNSTA